MISRASTHICTAVDTEYLCFLLALHQSVREHAPEWTIHVACLDQTSLALLEALAQEGLEPIPWQEIESVEPRLSVVREVRPRYDFVMTCKPFVLRHVLTGGTQPDTVTWLDADAMCFASLDSLASELAKASVLVTPLGASPAFRWVEERTGRFMGGLVAFGDDQQGKQALDWWAERCLFGGCPRTPDPKRFGDQKYLGELASTFPSVHIVEDPALRLAPANIECHDIVEGSGGPLVDGHPLVLYQYTGFRTFRNGAYKMSFPPWRIRPKQQELIYEPFFARVQEARRLLQSVEPSFDAGLFPRPRAIDRAFGVGSRTKGTMHRARHRLRSLGFSR